MSVEEIDARLKALDAEQNADFALLDTLGDPTDPLVVSRRIRLRNSYRRELARTRDLALKATPAVETGPSSVEDLARNTLTSPDSAPDNQADDAQPTDDTGVNE